MLPDGGAGVAAAVLFDGTAALLAVAAAGAACADVVDVADCSGVTGSIGECASSCGCGGCLGCVGLLRGGWTACVIGAGVVWVRFATGGEGAACAGAARCTDVSGAGTGGGASSTRRMSIVVGACVCGGDSWVVSQSTERASSVRHSTPASTNATAKRAPSRSASANSRCKPLLTMHGDEKVLGSSLACGQHGLHDDTV